MIIFSLIQEAVVVSLLLFFFLFYCSLVSSMVLLAKQCSHFFLVEEIAVFLLIKVKHQKDKPQSTKEGKAVALGK